jgi:tRNA (adenine22-N1)-methyltransferase
MALTGRLQFIYENLLLQRPVWDFCCDHGYLGIEALRSEAFSEVYFVDQVPQIVSTLENLISTKFGTLRPQAHIKTSRGEDVDQAVKGNVVIAGVGAFTIFEILENLWRKKNLQADRLILCPQRDENKFLKMLSNIGSEFSASYKLSGEHVLQEKTRSRFIYILDRA